MNSKETVSVAMLRTWQLAAQDFVCKFFLHLLNQSTIQCTKHTTQKPHTISHEIENSTLGTSIEAPSPVSNTLYVLTESAAVLHHGP